MKVHSVHAARLFASFAACALLVLANGCSTASRSGSPTGPMLPSPGATNSAVTVSGTVVDEVHPAASPAGIVVSVVATALSTTTDGSGHFVLSQVPAGNVVLMFSSAGRTLSLSLNSLAPGSSVTVNVALGASQAHMQGDPATREVEGQVSAVDVAGASLTVAGTLVRVDGATQWDATGDATNLQAVADALAAGKAVAAGAKGLDQTDGSLLATALKIEVADGVDPDHDDGVDQGGQDQTSEVEGAVSAVDLAAATLTVDGRIVHTDAATLWSTKGDLQSLQAVADALAAGQAVQADAKGASQVDGSLQATSLMARVEDTTGQPQKGEMEGLVSAVDTTAGTITLAKGGLVRTSAATVLSGDAASLAALEALLAAGQAVEARAKGTVAADGALDAATVRFTIAG